MSIISQVSLFAFYLNELVALLFYSGAHWAPLLSFY